MPGNTAHRATGRTDTPHAGTGSGRRVMRACAAVATASGPDGTPVLRRLASAPPLTLRQTGPCAVHLVSTAAGPLGGDRLALDLDVAPHTTLELGSVASTLVLPGEGVSELLVTARVGAGATLRFAPEPTVLAAGCEHRLLVRLALEPDASVLWREEIVFGRYGEASGRCHARFDVTCGGLPLLRQEFVVGEPALDASPAVYGAARCVGNTFLTASAGETVVADGVAVLPLALSGTLVSALAADAVQLRSRLEWGERAARTSMTAVAAGEREAGGSRIDDSGRRRIGGGRLADR
ncbi:urease accessory protein UreD [Nonomuraea deserti]|uniref:Urease accessory protein UreD n=1 Tax=Nonomuraea deserti TaxID=1848322 RepID=A0A4R4V730_9ACTN|nr:urease accessory protein UreD [Nonomuraea deserti]TDD01039.1 urease accessory protein UreD [Nonomuraea deserti]